MKGRKPTPGVLRALRGHSDKRVDDQAMPASLHPLVPPDDLSAAARAVWEYTVGQMPPDQLSGIDRDLLRAYVAAVVIHRQAERELDKHGAVVVGPRGGRATASAWLRILALQAEAIRRLGEQLGIGPAARARLRMPTAPTDAATDEYIRFIRRVDEKRDNENPTGAS